MRWRFAAAFVGVLVTAFSVVVFTPSVAEASGCPTVDSTGLVSPSPAPLVDWAGCDLTGANLSNADLPLANLAGAILVNVTLTGAVLSGATLTGVVSSGIIGIPNSLPSGWGIVDGALVQGSAPSAPTIGIALAGSGQVTLSWSAPANDGARRSRVMC